MKRIKQKNSGFTLIEITVVLAIIAILATLILTTFYNVRADTRDTRRVASITQLRDVLETYYRDEGTYPVTVDIVFGEQFPLESKIPPNGLIYMKEVPSNPSPRDDGDCPDEEFGYMQRDGGISYTITFCLGDKSGHLLAGTNIATPAGIIPED
ncbi:MAG: type II secretion system protein [bacterium]